MTPREPDRYDKAALEIWGGDFTPAGFAAALRREHDAALDEAAQIVEERCYKHGPRPVSWCEYCRLAGKIRARASPAAAPAADQHAEPAAPAPDLRCEACGDRLADEDAMRAHDRTWHGTVEAELRDRIAELECQLAARTSQGGAVE